MVLRDGVAPSLAREFVEKFDCEQTRVAFVHVKTLDRVTAQRAQHAHAANTENDFLAEPITFISAVEKMRESAIPVRVLRQIGVEKVNRHYETAYPRHFVSPGATPPMWPHGRH